MFRNHSTWKQNKLLEKENLKVDNLQENHEEYIKYIKLILKFRSEKHNVFTEEIGKIALSANSEKRIQPID